MLQCVLYYSRSSSRETVSCNVLQRVAMCCSVLYYSRSSSRAALEEDWRRVAMCCSVLRCVEVRCSVVQCVVLQ